MPAAFRLYSKMDTQWGSSGQLLAFGYLKFYTAGGPTTPKNVYGEQGLSTNNGSQIDLDAAGRPGLDEGLLQVRAQFSRFVADRVTPIAQAMHRDNGLVPLELVGEMAALGVFGLSLPEAYGGSGLGKHAMVVVTESGVDSSGPPRSDVALTVAVLSTAPWSTSSWESV